MKLICCTNSKGNGSFTFDIGQTAMIAVHLCVCKPQRNVPSRQMTAPTNLILPSHGQHIIQHIFNLYVHNKKVTCDFFGTYEFVYFCEFVCFVCIMTVAIQLRWFKFLLVKCLLYVKVIMWD